MTRAFRLAGVIGLAAAVASVIWLARPWAPQTAMPAVNSAAAGQRMPPPARQPSDARARTLEPATGTGAQAAPAGAAAQPGGSEAASSAASASVAGGGTAAASTTPPVESQNAAVAAGSKPAGALRIEIAKDTVIGIRLDQALSSDNARVDDKVTAKVSRDVLVDGRVAIAAGTRLEGVLELVDRGASSRERAKLGMRFQTLVLTDDRRVPIQAEIIIRLADTAGAPPAATTNSSSAIGQALITGGRQAASGGRPAMRGGQPPAAPRDARLPAGAPLTLKLTAALTIPIA